VGFEGLEKIHHNKEGTERIVKLAGLLQLEVDAKDVLLLLLLLLVLL
jgi:hypothetical protein